MKGFNSVFTGVVTGCLVTILVALDPIGMLKFAHSLFISVAYITVGYITVHCILQGVILVLSKS